jgi:hypothetical protein
MARIPVFYSFHFDNDVMRVQQIRNMGVIDGDEPVSPNDWEQIKKRGKSSIQNWIDENMKYKRCVVVLIGEQTAERPWVHYEIQKAWESGKGLLGIHIHNLKCPRQGTCQKGANPFARFKLTNGQSLADHVNAHDPWWDTYAQIRDNLQSWVDAAVQAAKSR